MNVSSIIRVAKLSKARTCLCTNLRRIVNCIATISALFAVTVRFAATELEVLSRKVQAFCCHSIVCKMAISNKYLLKPSCRTEDVEWGYAFDVHLNAFFPPLVVLHVFQLFFSRLLSHHISLLFGNTLWLIALGYYIYITFLGYSALPILKNTHIFLYPLALLFVCYIVTLVCNVNLCEALNDFYAYRVM